MRVAGYAAVLSAVASAAAAGWRLEDRGQVGGNCTPLTLAATGSATTVRHGSAPPSQLTLLFKVECRGSPVLDLRSEDVTVLEDGLVPDFAEAPHSVDPTPGQAPMLLLVLLDLSGSVARNSAAVAALAAAVAALVQTAHGYVGDPGLFLSVASFDGRRHVFPLCGACSDPQSLLDCLHRRLLCDGSASSPCHDPSTNLYGGMESALRLLRRQAAELEGEAGWGVAESALETALLVFADGEDMAGFVTAAEVASVAANTTVAGISVGAAAAAALRPVCNAGLIPLQPSDNVTAAFVHTATTVRRHRHSTYRLRYCAQARAGDHDWIVRVGSAAVGGTFDATGFGPGCRRLLLARDDGRLPGCRHPNYGPGDSPSVAAIVLPVAVVLFVVAAAVAAGRAVRRRRVLVPQPERVVDSPASVRTQPQDSKRDLSPGSTAAADRSGATSDALLSPNRDASPQRSEVPAAEPSAVAAALPPATAAAPDVTESTEAGAAAGAVSAPAVQQSAAETVQAAEQKDPAGLAPVEETSMAAAPAERTVAGASEAALDEPAAARQGVMQSAAGATETAAPAEAAVPVRAEEAGPSSADASAPAEAAAAPPVLAASVDATAPTEVVVSAQATPAEGAAPAAAAVAVREEASLPVQAATADAAAPTEAAAQAEAAVPVRAATPSADAAAPTEASVPAESAVQVREEAAPPVQAAAPTEVVVPEEAAPPAQAAAPAPAETATSAQREPQAAAEPVPGAPDREVPAAVRAKVHGPIDAAASEQATRHSDAELSADAAEAAAAAMAPEPGGAVGASAGAAADQTAAPIGDVQWREVTIEPVSSADEVTAAVGGADSGRAAAASDRAAPSDAEGELREATEAAANEMPSVAAAAASPNHRSAPPSPIPSPRTARAAVPLPDTGSEPPDGGAAKPSPAQAAPAAADESERLPGSAPITKLPAPPLPPPPPELPPPPDKRKKGGRGHRRSSTASPKRSLGVGRPKPTTVKPPPDVTASLDEVSSREVADAETVDRRLVEQGASSRDSFEEF
eukprot:TRINITY_DN1752_c0_g1_i2.p1 TRINITY_DN1752_c0_g1~~TRINITY_DN1752_c0_g1_i2.p1  ORF type:complete len:1048 (+),score=224.75 TRINITY_DN1752_c0_g1_i2:51-3146(+)